MENYLREAVCEDDDADPLLFWSEEVERDPKMMVLARLARKYLASPARSAASERLFKKAKDISSGKRVNLMPENVEKLLFCKYNLKALGGHY